ASKNVVRQIGERYGVGNAVDLLNMMMANDEARVAEVEQGGDVGIEILHRHDIQHERLQGWRSAGTLVVGEKAGSADRARRLARGIQPPLARYDQTFALEESERLADIG